jgi:RHS repeat-associated protein
VALLRNALGSTVGLVNSAGSIATQDTYEPFGKTSTSGASTTNTYAFAGRELDPSGLYFMRARYYNPLLSRFISSDPLGLGGGQANFFAYAYNSPMNFVDPLGLSGSSGGSPPQPNDGYDYTHEMPSPATTPGGGVNGNIQGSPSAGPKLLGFGLSALGGIIVGEIINPVVGGLTAFGMDLGFDKLQSAGQAQNGAGGGAPPTPGIAPPASPKPQR